eukprot:7219139-Alexandrium_andersonii.AAC.1
MNSAGWRSRPLRLCTLSVIYITSRLTRSALVPRAAASRPFRMCLFGARGSAAWPLRRRLALATVVTRQSLLVS